ncbi:hypothetical protein ACH3VR_18825 [Microbacterium sp. B2969]|uniref:DNA alkylation repair protein n=1 Tax=Microbacterium alkaliflavum TaxID=3248839 RepID=A0ABW7QC21_9MICO
MMAWWRKDVQGPADIGEWTLEERSKAYAQLVRFVPPELADETTTRAFAALPDPVVAAVADRLLTEGDRFSWAGLSLPAVLAVRLRERIEVGDPLTLKGWLAVVADGFFADPYVQSYLAACVREVKMPEPPRIAAAWARTLPEGPRSSQEWVALRDEDQMRRLTRFARGLRNPGGFGSL